MGWCLYRNMIMRLGCCQSMDQLIVFQSMVMGSSALSSSKEKRFAFHLCKCLLMFNGVKGKHT
jgi:purine-nucleoside phosphorylase